MLHDAPATHADSGRGRASQQQSPHSCPTRARPRLPRRDWTGPAMTNAKRQIVKMLCLGGTHRCPECDWLAGLREFELAAPSWFVRYAALALPVIDGANIGPDSFDLVRLQRTAPGRHLALAVEHAVEIPIMVARAQSPEVESHSATGVAQLFAMATGAVIGVEPFTTVSVGQFSIQRRQDAHKRGCNHTPERKPPY